MKYPLSGCKVHGIAARDYIDLHLSILELRETGRHVTSHVRRRVRLSLTDSRLCSSVSCSAYLR